MKKLLWMLLPAVGASAQAVPVASLEAQKLEPAVATYLGKEATRLAGGEGGGIAVVKGSTFRSGVIEVELAGKPSASASAAARGFIGVAFRVQNDGSKYEAIYLRPPTAAPTTWRGVTTPPSTSHTPNGLGSASARKLLASMSRMSI